MEGPGGQRAPRDSASMLDMMDQSVYKVVSNLTDAQKAPIHEMNVEAVADRMAEMRSRDQKMGPRPGKDENGEKPKLSKAEQKKMKAEMKEREKKMKEEMEMRKTERENKLKGILSDAQYKEYKDFNDKLESLRESRRQGGPGGPGGRGMGGPGGFAGGGFSMGEGF